MTVTTDVTPDHTTRVLDHGFVRLDDAMADDLSVVNGARVSFAQRKLEMDASDEGLIRFLMRDRHGSPFEHNAFRFHVRCPIFVAREWFRHRIGCLTGDTSVTFVDINGHVHQRKTIDELVRMWRLGESDGHASSASLRDARWRVRKMRVRVLDEQTGEFTVGHIGDVIDKGAQPVHRLTLEDGKQITLTENHRVLTDGGWARMGEAVGLTGSGAAAQMTRECRVLVNGIDKTTLVHSPEQLAAIRSARSGAAGNFWRGGVGESHRAIHRSRDAEIAFMHRSADRIGVPEDVDVPSRRGFTLTAHPIRIVALQYVGVRQTYDLSIDGPWHNFVANGVVVHNSFNEFSMRYAKATDDFYVPEADDVRTQVGKPGAYRFEPVSDELAEQAREELQAVYEHAFATYTRLVEAGVARELARAVMPVGAYTQFYWTVNARALMNFVSLRNSEFAQLEIRRYAEVVEGFFAERMPVTHAAFVANDRTSP